MTAVSEFLGMTFKVVYEEGSEPHIRVVYWGWDGPELSAKYGLESRAVIEGWLPELGMEEIDLWTQEHQAELEQAWENSRTGRPLALIEPPD